MAKYSNLDVLGNIKLNGAIYTKSNTEPSGFPAIKYSQLSGCWVYKNSSGGWIKFSDSDLDISGTASTIAIFDETAGKLKSSEAKIISNMEASEDR